MYSVEEDRALYSVALSDFPLHGASTSQTGSAAFPKSEPIVEFQITQDGAILLETADRAVWRGSIGSRDLIALVKLTSDWGFNGVDYLSGRLLSASASHK